MKNQSKTEQSVTLNANKPQIDLAIKLLKLNKNIILQGAPGTGKTYSTAEIALGVIDEEFQDHDQVMERYEELQKEGSIFFTTFHQSMDYEDFVEGLKPEVVEDGNGVEYVVTDGIFKQVCQAAEEDESPVVLIIDEINRGNVSKIFGELITLLEKDKRIGDDHPIRVPLPYSGESFGVPSNVYIIGTMNTTDRSAGTLDYALRRRFAFVTLKADKDVIQNAKGRELFEDVERFVEKFQTGEIELDDLMIGHSYFMAENDEELKLKIEYEVIPLLKEYVKDGLLNYREKEMNAYFEAWRNLQTKPAPKDEDGTNP